MPGKMIRQTMFSTGEVDQTTWKRTDVQEYISAAQSLENCEVGTTGLVRKRKGTEMMLNATAYAQANSRMYEFIDKNGNHYLLMSVDQHIHVFDAPTEGVQVVTGRGNDVVTGRGTNVVAHEQGLPFVQTLDTPYRTPNLDEVDYAQDNDALILSHPLYAPGRIYISDYATNPPTFAFEYLDIYPLPAYDFGNINYSDFDVTLSVAAAVLTFAFTGVGADPGFNNDWIGGLIVGGGLSETSPLGYAIITAVSYGAGGGGTVTFTGLVQQPFETDPTKYAPKGSQYSIKQPAWSAALGYPAKVLFYQNRLWFANTKALNNTVFGSKINTPINFDVGTGRDTDAIIYSVGVNNSGAIVWLNGGKQLEVYCQNIECACPQDQNSALTPTTFVIKQQSSYGASIELKPITYINDSYYSNKTGKAFINFHYNGVGLTYVASNISAASSHLVKNPSNRALLRGSDQTQDNFVYFLNPDDDTITAFQFASEYKLAALTPIVFQDDVSLIDIVTIANEVYILKYYNLTGTFTVERFNPEIKIDSSREASMASSGLITGLDTLDGYTVQVVYQNQDFGQYLVEDGEITVDNPEEIADTVAVGLLYDVDILPMYPFYDSAAAPFMKNISRIYVDYYQSLNFYINNKLVPYQNFADIQAGLPLQPQTGTAIIAPVSGWARFDNDALRITQSSPFDLQILSIGYQIDMAVL
ncbi:hypothetical protein KW791_00075 [Candidatus Parcubacteria bacterium]|nr:hypothetical protein [Candidatus Parcubacteria bacterium]